MTLEEINSLEQRELAIGEQTASSRCVALLLRFGCVFTSLSTYPYLQHPPYLQQISIDLISFAF